MSKLSSMEEFFAGRHFDREVIILCVRWYLRYKLSLRDLVEMDDGRARAAACPYHHPALGTAVRARVH